MSPSLRQFEGCLIGQCLGDALGFPVEGQNPEICHQYVLKNLVEFPAKLPGRAHFPFGQYTDDSQLARELIQSYVEHNGEFIPEAYAKRIAAIFSENRIIGRGMATQRAAYNLIQGVPWEKAGTPPPYAGNGSAMRAAPIGLFFYEDQEQLVKGAIDQGRITHTDPRCNAGSVTIAGSVAQVLQQETIESAKILEKLTNLVKPIDKIMAQGLENLHDWVKLSPEEAVGKIAPYGVEPDRQDLMWEGISPFVISSVLWSLYSFLRTPSSYITTISTAISVGGDVDTTAAMAGAISGAYLGIEVIPAQLAKQLTDQGSWRYHDLLNIAKECFRCTRKLSC